MVHRNLPTTRGAFQRVIEPFREHVVVCVECVFNWYWIADLCAELGVSFVLGHAVYMRAIHGGKTKNDKIDSECQPLPAGRQPHLLRQAGQVLARVGR